MEFITPSEVPEDDNEGQTQPAHPIGSDMPPERVSHEFYDSWQACNKQTALPSSANLSITGHKLT